MRDEELQNLVNILDEIHIAYTIKKEPITKQMYNLLFMLVNYAKLIKDNEIERAKEQRINIENLLIGLW